MFGPQGRRKRPCPVCTNIVGGIDANAADLGQHVALKVLGCSPGFRQRDIADERGWAGDDFVQAGDDYARDIGTLAGERLRLLVFKRDGDEVRLFWADEIGDGMEDPGQIRAARPSSPVRSGTCSTSPGRPALRLVPETPVLSSANLDIVCSRPPAERRLS